MQLFSRRCKGNVCQWNGNVPKHLCNAYQLVDMMRWCGGNDYCEICLSSATLKKKWNINPQLTQKSLECTKMTRCSCRKINKPACICKCLLDHIWAVGDESDCRSCVHEVNPIPVAHSVTSPSADPVVTRLIPFHGDHQQSNFTFNWFKKGCSQFQGKVCCGTKYRLSA